MNWDDHRGFTLVELSITIAIIGVLASISIPEYLAMQNSARRTEVPTVVDSLHTLEKAYFVAHDEYVIISTPQPRTVPDKTLQAWPSGTDFDLIEWEPDGPVRGTYRVDAGSTDGTFRIVGQCDVDNDAMLAEYYATQDIGVQRATPTSVY